MKRFADSGESPGRTHSQASPMPAYSQPLLMGMAFSLLIAGDSFCLSFLPLYAGQIGSTLLTLPSGLTAGLPITTFWLAVALAQLTTSFWERGRDRRALTLVSAALCVTALLAAGLASDLLVLAAARSASGFGYGMSMMLAQDYLLRAYGAERRTFASGLYLSLFFWGSLAGTFLGSHAAAMAGYPGAFLVGAGLCLLSLGLSLWLRAHREAVPPSRMQPLTVLRNRKLLLLVLFGAVPTRVINSGFVFFLTPLYLKQIGTGTAMIGLIVSIYSLTIALTSVAWARLVDHVRIPFLFTVLGLLISAASTLIVPLLGPSAINFGVALFVLGTAQAIGMSPQITVLFQIGREEVAAFGQTSVVGLYRVCERIGLMSGPLIVGCLLETLPQGAVLPVLGGFLGACGAILALSLRDG